MRCMGSLGVEVEGEGLRMQLLDRKAESALAGTQKRLGGVL